MRIAYTLCRERNFEFCRQWWLQRHFLPGAGLGGDGASFCASFASQDFFCRRESQSAFLGGGSALCPPPTNLHEFQTQCGSPDAAGRMVMKACTAARCSEPTGRRKLHTLACKRLPHRAVLNSTAVPDKLLTLHLQHCRHGPPKRGWGSRAGEGRSSPVLLWYGCVLRGTPLPDPQGPSQFLPGGSSSDRKKMEAVF